MFSHVMLGAADLQASRQFYDAVLAPLGTAPGVANRHRYFWRGAGGTFSVSTPINGQAATHAKRRHHRLCRCQHGPGRRVPRGGPGARWHPL